MSPSISRLILGATLFTSALMGGCGSEAPPDIESAATAPVTTSSAAISATTRQEIAAKMEMIRNDAKIPDQAKAMALKSHQSQLDALNKAPIAPSKPLS